jgi:hypothetical protein
MPFLGGFWVMMREKKGVKCGKWSKLRAFLGGKSERKEKKGFIEKTLDISL